MKDAPKRERSQVIIALALSAGIVIVMAAVHTFMKVQGSNTISTKMPRRSVSAAPRGGKTCAVTSRPSGATVYALRPDGREALGVTPLAVDQGDYRIVIELRGYHPATIDVGSHEEPCALHQDLRAK